MARKDLQVTLANQVKRSLEEGAALIEGGPDYDGDGFFFPPTILEVREPDNAARREEFFGPVAIMIPARDESHAIEIANETDYGLGASLWTSDLDKAKRLIPRIDAGCVFVNEFVKSDPRVPFGGIKDSGYGRELSGEGIREFVNRKTVWIA